MLQIRENKMKFHEDKSTPGPLQYFVFGSNLAGRHGRGAAHAARLYYGAVYGVGEGITGRCYAIPTKDAKIQTLPLEEIQKYVNKFIEHVLDNPYREFFITRVGCGLAGYKNSQVAPMFKSLVGMSNVSFPEPWRKWLTN